MWLTIAYNVCVRFEVHSCTYAQLCLEFDAVAQSPSMADSRAAMRTCTTDHGTYDDELTSSLMCSCHTLPIFTTTTNTHRNPNRAPLLRIGTIARLWGRHCYSYSTLVLLIICTRPRKWNDSNYGCGIPLFCIVVQAARQYTCQHALDVYAQRETHSERISDIWHGTASQSYCCQQS